MATRIQPREWEKKKKWQMNNTGLGQLKVQEGELCNTAFFVTLHSLFHRLTRDVHFSQNFYKLLGMPTHLWPSSSLLTVVDSGLRTHLVCLPHCPWTISPDWSLLLSVIDGSSASPFATALSGLLFPTPSLAFPCQLMVSSKMSTSGLCLASLQNRQRDRLLGGPPA